MRKNFLILFSVPLLVGCNFETQPGFKVEEEIITNHHEYEEVNTKFVSWGNVFHVPLDHYFVYFYSITCSHCAEIKDWIIESALEKQNTYFCKASAADVIVEDIRSSIGSTNVDNLSILGYPSLIEIKDGKVSRNVAGKTNIKIVIDNS